MLMPQCHNAICLHALFAAGQTHDMFMYNIYMYIPIGLKYIILDTPIYGTLQQRHSHKGNVFALKRLINLETCNIIDLTAIGVNGNSCTTSIIEMIYNEH